jgi:hypothetical protein
LERVRGGGGGAGLWVSVGSAAVLPVSATLCRPARQHDTFRVRLPVRGARGEPRDPQEGLCAGELAARGWLRLFQLASSNADAHAGRLDDRLCEALGCCPDGEQGVVQPGPHLRSGFHAMRTARAAEGRAAALQARPHLQAGPAVLPKAQVRSDVAPPEQLSSSAVVLAVRHSSASSLTCPVCACRRDEQRLHEVTLQNLVDKRVREFCWLFPGEGGGATDGQLWPHGGDTQRHAPWTQSLVLALLTTDGGCEALSTLSLRCAQQGSPMCTRRATRS